MAIRTVVIGLGSMGTNHVRIQSDLAGVELVGAADPRASVRAKKEAKYGMPVFEDYRRMLDELKPDAVIAAVPTDMHADVSIEALERGCHVMVEKPIAPSIADAERMIAAAKKADRLLMVGHIERFNPAVVEIARRVRLGELGKIFQLHARRLSPFPGRIQDVGVTLDLATHDIDAMHMITGETPVRVFGETARQAHETQEDMVSGTLRFPSGPIGVLDVNWLSPKKLRQLSVTGEGGVYLADYLTQDVYWYKNGQLNTSWEPATRFSGAVEGDEIKTYMPKKEPLKIEHEEFVRAVSEGLSSPCSGEDGLAALRVALALVQSGESGEAIRLR